MSDSDRPTPVFWGIAVVSLLWHAMGGMIYYQSVTRAPAYLEQVDPAQLAFMEDMETWAIACWAIAVWSALLASALLVMRNKLAVTLFLVSLLGMVGTTIHNFVIKDGASLIEDAQTWVMTLLIPALGIFLWVWSGKQAKKGVLR